MELMSAKTAARRYDCSVQSIWNWAREGVLPQPVRIQHGKNVTARWRVRECDIAMGLIDESGEKSREVA